MTLEQILNYLNYICVKENSGSNLTPLQYNTILDASNINMFNKKVQEAQLYSIQAKIPFNEALYSINALKEFHVVENIVFTTGIFDITTLTNNYAYWCSMITDVYNGSNRRVELLTDYDLTERRTNILTKRLVEYPAAMLVGNTIKIYPTNIIGAEFVFLKNPVKPVFDYYLDQYAIMVYLSVGATHVLTTGEVGSGGQTAGQTVTSATVELEWNQLYHVEFCNEILQKTGIQLKDEQIRQYIREVEGKQK